MSKDKDTARESTLSSTLDEALAAARPRLLRLAQQQGVAPDAVDDVVQETLVEAWRHFEYLRTSERFDAWLNGICRNVSLRWNRIHITTLQRQESLSALLADIPPAHVELDILDPVAIDPGEELCRQDLAILLDRAMGYLPATTRKALEMHYLAEIPQNETALQLGLTINALEVRLHRARQQLRRVLSNELRSDAEAFGMAIDKEMAQGWRNTSIWCFMCGQHQMFGMFEQMQDGEINLRLRCPSCSTPSNFDIVNTCGIVQLGNLRSFRPAIKHAMAEMPQFQKQALAQRCGRCPACGTQAKVRGVEPYNAPHPFIQRFFLIMECPNDGICASGIISSCLYHPTVQQFFVHHPRCIIESEHLIESAGQEVIQIVLADRMSASLLTMLVSLQTLEILNVRLK